MDYAVAPCTGRELLGEISFELPIALVDRYFSEKSSQFKERFTCSSSLAKACLETDLRDWCTSHKSLAPTRNYIWGLVTDFETVGHRYLGRRYSSLADIKQHADISTSIETTSRFASFQRELLAGAYEFSRYSNRLAKHNYTLADVRPECKAVLDFALRPRAVAWAVSEAINEKLDKVQAVINAELGPS